jgi:hypothetical protein
MHMRGGLALDNVDFLLKFTLNNSSVSVPCVELLLRTGAGLMNEGRATAGSR